MSIFREKVFWISVLLVSVSFGFLFNYLYSNDLFIDVITPLETKKPAGDDSELKKQIGQMIMIGFRGTEASADSYFERSEKQGSEEQSSEGSYFERSEKQGSEEQSSEGSYFERSEKQGSEEQSSEGSYIAKVIQDLKIGGVVLFDYDVPSKSFPRNIINPEQTKKLIASLKSYSTIPLFVAVDAEGGKVDRLKSEYGFIAIPSPVEMGQGSVENTEKIANGLAKELKDLGFNMNLAPVVDVNINPKNPIIGGLDRSFSADPAQVFEHAKAFILAHRQNNIITVAKHFPGHGSSSNDSHLGIVEITQSYKEEELIPYERLQDEGLLDSVMIAHVINRNVDANFPATLSPLFIEGILRN